jgi:D-glycero-D-manno-heptose 1,7-bisphosphate phosphatase
VGIAAVRAVFLDRDGVLNEATAIDGYPSSPLSAAGLRILPGTREALERLKAAGFMRIVVTNQPDVARGRMSSGTLEAMHDLLHASLPLTDVLVCPHDNRDSCACRKPRAGLLHEAARRHGIDLGASFMVGDRWRDIGAGLAAGCMTVLIDRGYAERRAEGMHATVQSLAEAVDWILSRA